MNSVYQLDLENGKCIFVNPEDKRGVALINSRGQLNSNSKKTWLYIAKLHSWDFVVDIGSNYGEMVVALDLEKKTRVYCYEANPDLADNYLAKTIAQLGNDNVSVVKIALGEEEKEDVDFYIDTVWSGTSGLSKKTSVKLHHGQDNTKTIKTRIGTLDREINLAQSSVLMKIDVEGNEKSVLLGAISNLKSCTNCIVMLESLHLSYPDFIDIHNLLPDYEILAFNLEAPGLVRVPVESEVAFSYFRGLSTFNHQDYVLAKNVSTSVKMAAPIRNKKYVVYTALIGDSYEEPNRHPFPQDDNCDYICFTNIPGLYSDNWNVVQVTPYFPRDNIRSARYLKIMGPLLLGDYEASLWIDNSVSLKKPPSQIIDEWLSDSDFALPDHSFRSSIAAEFEAVESAGFDDPARIYEQLIAYANSYQQALLEKPFWTDIIARKHNDTNFSFLLRWWSHVLRYSRRDQLSFNFAAKEEHMNPKRILIDNHVSEYHVWPAIKNRNRKLTSEKISNCLRIPLMDLGAIHNELTRRQIMIDRLSQELEKTKKALAGQGKSQDN
jgi:FkbM family methyltransferase